MINHTPGPWTLSTVPTSAGSCHKIGPFPSSSPHRPLVHCCVYADGIRIGLDEKNAVARELYANAILIASAPELLASLIELRDLIDMMFGLGLSPLNGAEGSPKANAEAAIAKATGISK